MARPPAPGKPLPGKTIDAITHPDATRRNIPTAEPQSLVAAEDATPKQQRDPCETPLPQGETRPRNPDLDPQLVWRGKDQQDWSDLVAAAREAAEAGFPVMIACAFNYDAHASEFAKLGAVQVIRARMNPDLHMADNLKNTGSGNLFVIFGEPAIEITQLPANQHQVRGWYKAQTTPSTSPPNSSAPAACCWKASSARASPSP